MARPTEEWLSGRRHHTRNVAWGKPHREFESHLLRKACLLYYFAALTERSLHKKIMERYWFKAKKYGYGWYPATWEGWVVMAVWLVAFLRITVFFSAQMQLTGPANLYWYAPLVLLITGALVLVSWLKGEPAQWRRGSNDKR